MSTSVYVGSGRFKQCALAVYACSWFFQPVDALRVIKTGYINTWLKSDGKIVACTEIKYPHT